MTAAFLDTVGLLAIGDIADQWHEDAEHAFEILRQAKTRLLTTTFVLLECGNAAARRPYRAEPDILRDLLERRGELITPTDEDWRQAWHEYRKTPENRAGIVDCVSFVVMRRLGLNEAFTNDRHFAAAGFVTLF
ncbi:MAG: type II toxin-antitoxin system VapC family toxin [Planctomycetaceae bacterium]|nr:type II toxin-antitoxin system VapC family toxin [Planctomycetaceae bacterium]